MLHLAQKKLILHFRAWQQKLREKVKIEDERERMYSAIVKLMMEPTPSRYSILKDEFLSKYKATAFGKYFTKEYLTTWEFLVIDIVIQ